MPPVLLNKFEIDSAASDTSTLTSPAFTPANGDIIVVKTITEDASLVPGTPTNTSVAQTWRTDASDSTASHCGAKIFTTTVRNSPYTLQVSAPFAGTARWHSMVVEWWGNAILAATPATNSTKTGAASAPSATVTTVAANSVVTSINGDWTANAPAGHAYRSSATEDGLHDKSGTTSYVGYYFWQSCGAAGAQTIGMTAPASQTWTLLGIELQSGPGFIAGDAGPQTIPMFLPTLSYDPLMQAVVYPMRPWQRRFQWATQPWLNSDDVPAAVVVPVPPPANVGGRRPRPPTRRPRPAEPPWQVTVTAPATVWVPQPQTPRRGRWPQRRPAQPTAVLVTVTVPPPPTGRRPAVPPPPRRRGRASQAAPQITIQIPPPVQTRRPRIVPRRRGGSAQPVPAAIVVTVTQTPPPQPPTRRPRPGSRRRGSTAQPVPPPVAAAPSPPPPPANTPRPRSWWRPHPRYGRAEPPWPMAAVAPSPPPPPANVPRVRRAALPGRRARAAQPVPVTVHILIPPPSTRRRPLLPRRAGRTAQPVPPVVVTVTVPPPPMAGRRTRRWWPLRRRGSLTSPVPSVVHVCPPPTIRPDSGVTVRPSTGTTTRGATGTTARPGTGTTARPDSGTTPTC